MPYEMDPSLKKAGQKRNMSKRAELRNRRRKIEQRNRIIIIVAIVVAAVGIAALFILPNLPKKADTSSVKIPENLNFPQASQNTLGDPNAPVKVEEFFDFNCSHCMDYAMNQEDEILRKYVETGKVYYVDYIYAFMAESSATTAQAAYCAMDQGKYWEYKKTLFYNAALGNMEAYSNENLTAYAIKLGLDKTEFQQCFDKAGYESKITENMQYGDGLGVTGTPSFIVNGQLVSRDALDQAIQDALNK